MGGFLLSGYTINPITNEYILKIVQIINAVMTSASEADLGTILINVQEAVPQQKILEEMGHPNP